MPRTAGQTGKAAVLTAAEFDVIIESTRARAFPARDKAILAVSFYLGLRAKEIASLRAADVYTSTHGLRDVLHIKRSYSKKGRMRDVYLAAQPLRDILCQYRLARMPYAASDPLFATRSGRPFSANGMAHLFRDIFLAAGLETASSHSGRRTMITRLAERGVDLKALARIAGHSSISTTAIYIEDNPERLARFMAQLTY
jgi:integrase/recombinase XerD